MRSSRRSRGMAMVEMVFVLPVLLVLLFGIAELSIALLRYQTLSNAAREGARLAIVFRDTCDAATVQAQVQNTVESYVQTAGISPATLTITWPDGPPCQGTGVRTTVRVEHDHNFRVLGGLAPGLGTTLPLAAQSSMRNEG